MVITGMAADSSGVYEAPLPILRFATSPFPPEVLQRLVEQGFTAPTPIQAQGWPICCQGRDIVSVARTGSGKTLAFVLPMLLRVRKLMKRPVGYKSEAGALLAAAGAFKHLKKKKKRKGNRRAPAVAEPLAVVLAPTRELAMQIERQASLFGRPAAVNVTCVYGGERKKAQMDALRAMKPHVLIATPGRLLDLASCERVSLKRVAILVLDEADRMLDLGFEPQLEQLRQLMPPQLALKDGRPLPGSGKLDEYCRQTLLFTATWPRVVQAVSKRWVTNPVHLSVGSGAGGRFLVAAESVSQEVMVLLEHHREQRLQRVLGELPEGSKTIIFFATKRNTDEVCQMLWESGVECDSIHGDKEQKERNAAMRLFKAGEVPVLCATDVAARGLDVKDITHVINFDFPRPMGKHGIEYYVHRIGRTGRAGATGTAITFFTAADAPHAPALVEVLKRAGQPVPPELQEFCDAPKTKCYKDPFDRTRR